MNPLSTCNRKFYLPESLGDAQRSLWEFGDRHVSNNDDMPVPILSAMVPTIKKAYFVPDLMRLYSRRGDRLQTNKGLYDSNNIGHW